jgi:hypothetical protein
MPSDNLPDKTSNAFGLMDVTEEQSRTIRDAPSGDKALTSSAQLFKSESVISPSILMMEVILFPKIFLIRNMKPSRFKFSISINYKNYAKNKKATWKISKVAELPAQLKFRSNLLSLW